MICPDCETDEARGSGLCEPCTLDRILDDMMHLGADRMAQVRREADAYLKPKVVALACDGAKDCAHEVTMIDHKGWLYCSTHGPRFRCDRPVRKLRQHELNKLKRGEPLKSY